MASPNTSSVVQRARDIVRNVLDRDSASEWCRDARDLIRDIDRRLERDYLRVQERQRLVASLAHLKTLLLQISRALLVVGTGAQSSTSELRVQWDTVNAAFQSRIKTGVILNVEHIDVNAFLNDAQKLFVRHVKEELEEHKTLKVNAILNCDFVRMKTEAEDVELRTFNTKNAPIFATTDLEEWFTHYVRMYLLKTLEDFEEEKDSGWSLHAIVSLVININKYNMMRASSFIELPKQIQTKKATVNVMNVRDNKCFVWSILAALNPLPAHSNPNRPSEYIQFQNQINIEGLDFPMPPKQVVRFEKQNKDISVNIYLLELQNGKFIIVPFHVSKETRRHHIHLLLIQEEDSYVDEATGACKRGEDDNRPVRFHYVLIKNLAKLVGSQLSLKKGKKFICDRCLHYFLSDDLLKDHVKDCGELNKCRVNLPKQGENVLKFSNYKNKERVPFIVYADLECILKKANRASTDTTKVVQEHEAFSIGYYFHCSYDSSLSGYHSFRGHNPAAWFAQRMQALAEQLQEIYNNPEPMKQLTPTQTKDFVEAKVCHICEKSFSADDVRVRDHCHFTGLYRSAAHQKCNLTYQNSYTIPVVFHNFSGYDSHFVVKSINSYMAAGRINLIPLNMERYISFTKSFDGMDVKLRFIDSFRFMASSLEKLASYLPSLPITRAQHPQLSDQEFTLLTRKGVFPYEYIDSWEKLDETSIPPQPKFFSKLSGCGISEADYAHAQLVWNTFQNQTLGEYADLYLKTDVLLLADIFENFRTKCLSTYGLDPAHYFTAPGLTWDAMLKYTRIELELLTDIDMIMFIERGIRGGVSQCCHRYAKANNPYMTDYNSELPTSYIQYYDVNNLYGWAMEQYLPTGGFEWVPQDSLNQFDWGNIADDSDVGCILEVDIDYPAELHDSHKDFPFCPEQRKPPGSKQIKLLTTLYAKSRYIIHYRNLQQAVRHGLIVTQIHRILRFKQSAWLKNYIDLNTRMRQNAANDFEKNLYKLMNNATFGKTMENVRKRIDVKLVNKWEGRYSAEALISKPNFHSRVVFSEDLAAIQLEVTKVTLNKPIYVGFCVLDLSKACVYQFHYEVMPKLLNPQHYKLLYTDTDSLQYWVQCSNMFELVKQNICYFDTSDFSSDNPYGIPQVNKKVVGLMKDECAGQIVTEFAGLRSKMYSIRVEGKDFMKKCKGIKHSVVQRTLSFDDYKKCLDENSTQSRTQRNFISRLHDVYTLEQKKVALNPSDDKRFISGGYETLPWGHKDIVMN